MITKIIIYVLIFNLILTLLKKPDGNLYCGLVGFSGNSKFNIKNIQMLFLYNYIRGTDSSGFFTPENGIFKKKGKLVENLHDFQIAGSNLFIGHTRQGTVGSNTDENAHPFEENNIICAHNGFIKNWETVLENNGIIDNTIKVDSHGFTKLIAAIGLKAAIEETPNSAIATLVYFKDENALYVYRNKERPLFRGRLEEGLYISSTEESLKAIGCSKIKEFSEGYIYKIKEGVVEAPLKVSVKNEEVQTDSQQILHWGQYVTDYVPMQGMTNKKWYKLLHKSKNDMYRIENDKGDKILLSDYSLKYVKKFDSGQKIVATRDLYTANTTVNKGLLGKAGETFKFINYDFDFKSKTYRIQWEHPSGEKYLSDCWAFRHPEKELGLKVGNIVKRDKYKDSLYVITKMDDSGTYCIQVTEILDFKYSKNSFSWDRVENLTKVYDNLDDYIKSVKKQNLSKIETLDIPRISEGDTGIDIFDDSFKKMDEHLYNMGINIDDVYYKSSDFSADEYREFYVSMKKLIEIIEELKKDIKEEAIPF